MPCSRVRARVGRKEQGKGEMETKRAQYLPQPVDGKDIIKLNE